MSLSKGQALGWDFCSIHATVSKTVFGSKFRNADTSCPTRKINSGHKKTEQRVFIMAAWNLPFSCAHKGEAIPSILQDGYEVSQMEISGSVESFKVKEKILQSVIDSPCPQSKEDILLAHYIPVYVMLPLDVVGSDNKLVNVDFLHQNLRSLKAAHVDGLMVDVWWGLVEKTGPKCYDWTAYRLLFQLIKSYGFKLQIVMSFHQCGNNAADSCYIPLPEWVRREGKSNPDIYFTNRDELRNEEYLSFGIDNEPVLNGRTALEVYRDYMRSFKVSMLDFLQSDMITDIEVGLGPSGELRYPSFSYGQGWRFPGIGEFQCYDKYLLSDLRESANSIGHDDWVSVPEDAGHSNDWPQSTGFFCNGGSFTTDYGKFFLEWYSGILVNHGDAILDAASEVFEGCKVRLAAKIAGVHWWYKSTNHAAELAAGYYNVGERDGYKPIAKMLARHKAVLNFTCIEMRDSEHYWRAKCGPEDLVRQVMNAGWNEGIDVSCENALPRFDRAAFNQILLNARPDGINTKTIPGRRVLSFTYLRLGPELMQGNNWKEFASFVRQMHAGLEYHPDSERYFHPIEVLKCSKLHATMLVKPDVPVASVPLDGSHVLSTVKKNTESFFSQDAPGGGLGAQVENTSGSFPRDFIEWLWHGIEPPKKVRNILDHSIFSRLSSKEDLSKPSE